MLNLSFSYGADVSSYDRRHARWLRYAGGQAQCAFEAATTALLSPGDTMLDAACGTGALARRILAAGFGKIDITLLDNSDAMLRRCNELPVRTVHGDLDALPFGEATFDLVTCAWGLETLPHPTSGLAEILRVTKPGRHAVVVFCADRNAGGLAASVLQQHVAASGRGRFLKPESIWSAALQLGAREVRPLHATGPAAAAILVC